MKGTAEEQ
jgi:hypothetical protein